MHKSSLCVKQTSLLHLFFFFLNTRKSCTLPYLILLFIVPHTTQWFNQVVEDSFGFFGLPHYNEFPMYLLEVYRCFGGARRPAALSPSDCLNDSHFIHSNNVIHNNFTIQFHPQFFKWQLIRYGLCHKAVHNVLEVIQDASFKHICTHHGKLNDAYRISIFVIFIKFTRCC